MFRITDDPSSGSLCTVLGQNYKNGSIVSVDMYVVGVMTALYENSASLYIELYTRTLGQIMLPYHRLRPCQRTR